MSSTDVTYKVVVNLLLIALGYLLKRLGILSRENGRVLNRLVLYVTLPATSLLAISSADLSWGLLALPALFFLASMALWVTGLWPARALGLSRTDEGTFVVALCGFMGSLAYPFADAAYGMEGMRALAISDLGNAFAIFGVAYYLSFRYATNGQFSVREIARRLLTFVPLHTYWIGIALNLGHVQLGGVPGVFVETLSSVNSPLMLISLGLYLEFKLKRQEIRAVVVHTGLKYAVGLALAFLTVFALPYQGPQGAVAFLLPLMPAPLSTLLYSVEQGLNSRLAAMLISVGILISLAITTVTILGFRTAF